MTFGRAIPTSGRRSKPTYAGYCHPYRFLVANIAITLLGNASTSVAFMPSQDHSSIPTTTCRFYAGLDEESEWYSPPPAKCRSPTGTAAAEFVVESTEDFNSFVYDQDDGRLVIVKFHASWCVAFPRLCASPDNWKASDTSLCFALLSYIIFSCRCKSCARFKLHIDKLRSEHADLINGSGCIELPGAVRFASVEWTANSDLCRQLKITKLPTTRFYANTKLVHEFTVGAASFDQIKSATAFYLLKQQQQQSQADEKALKATLVKGDQLVAQVFLESKQQQAEIEPLVQHISKDWTSRWWNPNRRD
jgi:hypothetical protein